MERRRILLYLLVAALLGTAACAKSTSGDAEVSKKPKATRAAGVTDAPSEGTPEITKPLEVTASPEPTQVPEVTDAPQPTDAPKPTKPLAEDYAYGRLPVLTRQGYDFEMEGDDRIAFVEYGQIWLTNEGSAAYPALAQALRELSDGIRDGREQYLQTLAQDARLDMQDGELMSIYYVSSDVQVLRADGKILSLAVDYSDYTGGAHGYFARGGYNFVPQTGEEYKLGEIVVSMEALKQRLKELLNKKYSEVIMFDVGEYFDEKFQEDDAELVWTMDYDNLTFYFEPYELASFADGILSVAIPLLDATVIKPEFAEKPASYACEMSSGFPILVDWNGNGWKEEVNISAYDDFVDGTVNASVYFSGKEIQLDGNCWEFTPYLVHTRSGKEYVYLECMYYDVWAELLVLGEKNGQFDLIDTYYCSGFLWESLDNDIAGRLGFTDPECFYLSKVVEVIGTQMTVGKYSVGEDGMPVPEKDYYELDDEYGKRLKVDLEAVMEETGETRTIPAGSEVYLVRTDGETYVIVRANGVEYRLEIDNSDWPHKVNGKDEMELFEDVIYAG